MANVEPGFFKRATIDRHRLVTDHARVDADWIYETGDEGNSKGPWFCLSVAPRN